MFKLNNLIIFLISVVWLMNGFFCKILNLTPRHQDIVARILNEEYSREITLTIGILEILMVVWILSNYKSKFNVITQIIIIISMNIIEFIMAEDLLLFGKLNIVFALIFSSVIYYGEFIHKIYTRFPCGSDKIINPLKKGI